MLSFNQTRKFSYTDKKKNSTQLSKYYEKKNSVIISLGIVALIEYLTNKPHTHVFSLFTAVCCVSIRLHDVFVVFSRFDVSTFWPLHSRSLIEHFGMFVGQRVWKALTRRRKKKTTFTIQNISKICKAFPIIANDLRFHKVFGSVLLCFFFCAFLLSTSFISNAHDCSCADCHINANIRRLSKL